MTPLEHIEHNYIFIISNTEFFIFIFPTEQHIPQPLINQSWDTGWEENKPNQIMAVFH